MACPNPFDVLRMKAEDLGPKLYKRASHRSMEIAMTQRDEYPQGAGLARSSFTVQRSEPSSDEEAWPILTSVNSTAPDGSSQPNTLGACSQTWNQTFVGHLERKYGPETFGLVGPDLCVDELVIHWNSRQFWESFFQALEKRNVRSLENRLANISMNLVPHSANVAGTLFTGDPMAFNAASLSKSTTELIAPDNVYLGDLPAPTLVNGAITNYSEITQEALDEIARVLIEDGATDPDTDGWIQMGPEGPIFPIEIGLGASQEILRNNADFRADIRSAWQSMEEANPLLKRVGASQVIKNERHIVTAIPKRWDWVTKGNDGQAIGPNHLYTEPNSGVVYGASTNAFNTPYGNPAGCWVRRPVFIMSTASKFVTKGYSAEINPDWRNAQFEGVRFLNPFVFTEEVLRPMDSIGVASWRPQNYLGEWQFVRGIAAYVGVNGCTTPTGGDPLEKRGRHFGEYRHAAHPIFPEYGRLFIFQRCLGGLTTYRCS